MTPSTTSAAPPPRSHRRGGAPRGLCPDGGLTWNGTAAAHCPSCCLHFVSNSGFDRHRVNGCCLTPDELRRPGENGKPRLVETDRGWVTARMQRSGVESAPWSRGKEEGGLRCPKPDFRPTPDHGVSRSPRHRTGSKAS